MYSTKISLILSTMAGLSTLIGYLFIYIKCDKDRIVSKTLGFACGVMATVSITDLIPNSLILIKNQFNIVYTFILIIAGFLIGIILSNMIDTKVEKKSKTGPNLYKLGIISMLVIMMHNIPEGIVTYITSKQNISLGITLCIAIALHNIPEGISISIPIYYSTGSKLKAFIYTFISGISEPIGALISYLFLSKYVNNIVLGIIYSIIAGMMVNIAINELYKEAKNYNKINTIKYIIIGSIIMIINHLLFN